MFRLQAKNFLLTYSKINKSITRDDFLNHLVKRCNLNIEEDKYIISFEKHKNNENHCHILINLDKKPDIKNSRFFDYEINNNIVLHPNIKKVNFKERVFYVTKEDDEFLTNIKDIKLLKKDIFNKERYEFIISILVEKLQKVGLNKTLQYFDYMASPKTLGLYSGRVLKALRDVQTLKYQKTRIESRFPISSFKEVPEVIDYIKKIKSGNIINKALFISGEPQLGKTEYVLCISNEEGIKFSYAKNIEMLKDQDLEDTLIILDDSSLLKIEDREQFIAIFETVHPHTLPARYKDALIPANTPKIIIFNKTFEELLKIKNLENDQSFIGRVNAINLNEKLFINNLNVTINNNITVFSHRKTPEIDLKGGN